MKSKEEMIEVMARAEWEWFENPKSKKYQPWESLDEDLKESWRMPLRAALKALCEALPDAPLQVIGNGSVVTFTSDGLYNQLKQYGK